LPVGCAEGLNDGCVEGCLDGFVVGWLEGLLDEFDTALTLFRIR
jgi:hypothetical protein